MHKPLTSWKNVLSNLGRRVNWQNFYRSMQSRTPARRHQNSNAQLSFECLEDRTMLTTVPGLVVTTTVDVVDATDGVVSLREAITFANNQAGVDTVTFASGTGDAFATGGLIRLTQGELLATEALNIDASAVAAGVTISGDSAGDDTLIAGSFITDAINNTNTSDNSRVLNVTGGDSDLTIRGLTLTGGVANSDGGGINFASSGELTLEQSIVSGNSSVGDGGGISVFGDYAQTTITNSTISGNSANFGGGISSGVDTTSITCLLYTSPSPRDRQKSRMPSSA